MSHGPLAPTTVALVASNDPPASGVVPDPVLPAVAAGDDRAMDELWSRYADRVRALGLRLSSYDARFADDLVQETFAKLWRSASSFDPERGTETTFVFTVARRAAVDQWRRGRRAAEDRPLDHLPESTGAVTSGPSAPEAHVESVVTGWAVADALAGAARRPARGHRPRLLQPAEPAGDRRSARHPPRHREDPDVQRLEEPACRDDHERGDGMTDDLDLTEDHERIRVDLAGYVLGSLTLAEQQAVEVHLESCSACRAELAELEGIPVLLDLARPDAATPPPPDCRPPRARAPPRSRPHAARSAAGCRVLVGGRRAGRRRRAGGRCAHRSSRSTRLRSHDPAADRSGAVGVDPASGADGPSGTAALRPTDNGTVVRLDLEGLPDDGSWYECTWTSNQGDQSAGTFRPAADGTVHIDLTTAARAYPGWKLTIVEHPEGSAEGEAVLEASA